jgi:hypothetical protein
MKLSRADNIQSRQVIPFYSVLFQTILQNHNNCKQVAFFSEPKPRLINKSSKEVNYTLHKV